MREIRRRMNPVLRRGDEVYVFSDLFPAFLASVEQMDEQSRVWLLIGFMGRAIWVSADFDQSVPQCRISQALKKWQFQKDTLELSKVPFLRI